MPTADMLVTKILFDSVISTVGACFMTIEIAHFYLNTPPKHPELIHMQLSEIPEEASKSTCFVTFLNTMTESP